MAAATPGVAANAAGTPQAAAAGGSSSGVVPIVRPPESIESMVGYYSDWRTSIRSSYQQHLAKHKRFQWAKLFGKEAGEVASQRFSNTKEWLNFLDYSSGGSERPRKEADVIMNVMLSFAAHHCIDHSVMVRKVFNAMVKKGLKIDTMYAHLPQLLRKALEGAKFTVPLIEKQQQQKQQKRSAAEMEAGGSG